MDIKNSNKSKNSTKTFRFITQRIVCIYTSSIHRDHDYMKADTNIHEYICTDNIWQSICTDDYEWITNHKKNRLEELAIEQAVCAEWLASKYSIRCTRILAVVKYNALGIWQNTISPVVLEPESDVHPIALFSKPPPQNTTHRRPLVSVKFSLVRRKTPLKY